MFGENDIIDSLFLFLGHISLVVAVFARCKGKNAGPINCLPFYLLSLTQPSPATVSHDLLLAHYNTDQLGLNRNKSRIIFVFVSLRSFFKI